MIDTAGTLSWVQAIVGDIAFAEATVLATLTLSGPLSAASRKQEILDRIAQIKTQLAELKFLAEALDE